MGLFEVNREAKACAECDTSDPSQTESEVNFSPLMAHGALAQLQVASSSLSRHKQRTSSFLSNTHLDCKPYTSLRNKTQNTAVEMLSLLKFQRSRLCHLHPAGIL